MPPKKNIPKALKEQIWIKQFGTNTFRAKCPIDWCMNEITPFTYDCGHNIPESKGGETNIKNLIPICSKCNKSMSNNYTIDEWKNASNILNGIKKPYPRRKKRSWLCCFY
jgi:5-methylcytosine-specific restriction endonuclease McrA